MTTDLARDLAADGHVETDARGGEGLAIFKGVYAAERPFETFKGLSRERRVQHISEQAAS